MGPRVRDLEQRFDGPVPAPLLKAAKDLDEVEARFRRDAAAKSAGKPGKVTLKPAGIVAVMANHMIEIRALEGAVLERDLALRGWTKAEIDTYGPRAREIAAERCGVRHAVGTEI